MGASLTTFFISIFMLFYFSFDALGEGGGGGGRERGEEKA